MTNFALCAEPELIADYACGVGENPLWHPVEQRLLWTDITGGRLFRFDPINGVHEQFYSGRPVGGFTIQHDGSLLLFKDRGTITCWKDDRESTVIPEIPEERELRFNDVIADPQGRVFCGTYTDGRLGKLYRLDIDGTLTKLLDGIGCSNGMAFTVDLKTLFYTDSLAHVIYRFDYDQNDGSIRNRQVFHEVPESEGLPDGCTLDSEGCLWFACWGGSCLIRLDPAGKVIARILIPAKKTTSLIFAGPTLTDIYVTSEGGKHRNQSDPHAGALFHLTCNVPGRSEFFSEIAVPEHFEI